MAMSETFDAAVHEAAACISSRCTQLTRAPDGSWAYCDRPVEKFVVDHVNLVCDRYVAGTCAAGHTFASAIIE